MVERQDSRGPGPRGCAASILWGDVSRERTLFSPPGRTPSARALAARDQWFLIHAARSATSCASTWPGRLYSAGVAGPLPSSSRWSMAG
jgi:hypothetical protein